MWVNKKPVPVKLLLFNTQLFATFYNCRQKPFNGTFNKIPPSGNVV